MSLKDTICAIATPPGHGGIGIVRVSGEWASKVLEKIWTGTSAVSEFESHHMYYGKIFPPLPDPPPRGGRVREGVAIDTVLAVWMKAPHSYTGEDVVEISCHGGPAILEGILNACKRAGARLAEPGEFTKRAFINGRMDLAQAEAVADLISATSGAAAKCAREQLEGGLSRKVNDLIESVTEIRAFVEASIDFPEEDIELLEQAEIGKRIGAVAAGIRLLADTYNEGRIFKDGVAVAIVGRPNVGKSSLFNALVGRERAIVHHTSGTTRDLVSETVQIGGIAFHLTDCAGIRENGHDVEKIGIEKAKAAIENADIALFVMDSLERSGGADKKILEALDEKRTVVCINKSDLLKKNGKEPKDDGRGIRVSALCGDGIESLKKTLLETAKCKEGMRAESVVVTSARHKEALLEAAGQIDSSLDAVEGRKSAEFVAHHLHLAHDALGRITGKVAVETLLEKIFSHFCIGK